MDTSKWVNVLCCIVSDPTLFMYKICTVDMFMACPYHMQASWFPGMDPKIGMSYTWTLLSDLGVYGRHGNGGPSKV